MIYSVSRYTEVPYFFMDKFMSFIDQGVVDFDITEEDEKGNKIITPQKIDLNPGAVSGFYLWSKKWDNYYKYQEVLEQNYRVVYNHSAPLLPPEITGGEFFNSVDQEILHLVEMADRVGKRMIWHLAPIMITSITPKEYWFDVINKAISYLKSGANYALIDTIVISLYEATPYSERRLYGRIASRSGLTILPMSYKEGAQFTDKISKITYPFKVKVTSCRNPYLVANKTMGDASCIGLEPLKQCIGSISQQWSILKDYPSDIDPALDTNGYPFSHCKCVRHIDLGFLFDHCPASCNYCLEKTKIDIAYDIDK